MGCVHPIPAWREHGVVSLREPREWAEEGLGAVHRLQIPCGSCIGCRMSRAREWSLRCQLELSQHQEVCFVTLTYGEDYVPPTLRKGDLSGWIKRVRRRLAPRPVRFFGCGEYGEVGKRPHYHAILFGVRDDARIRESWAQGFVSVGEVTPESISYVAGYTAKKEGVPPLCRKEERLDVTTGELYHYQPPFLLMSRNPGIGGAARKFWRSWRSKAIFSGLEVPVPRFLHASFLANASLDALSSLEAEKLEKRRLYSRDELLAVEASARTRAEHSLSKRRKL